MRLFLVLILASALAFPALAQETTPESESTIVLEGGAADDAAIESRIRSILAELEGYENVTISVQSGVVTLSGRTLDAESLNRLESLVGRVEGVVAIENEAVESTDLAERLTPAWDRILNRTTQFVSFIPLLLVALTALVLVAGLGFFIASRRSPWDRIAPNEFIADIYRQFVRIAFLVGGLVVTLDILGATALLGTILGAAGIIGLAIGFAVKDTVENFIASIMLSIRQPFRPNDLIEIDGDLGKVIRLTSRATILLSQEGNHIRIPNSTVFSSRIVNYSRNVQRRFDFDHSIDPESDIGAARQLCQDTIQALPFVLAEPSALVWVEGIDDAGVVLRATGWIDQNEASFHPAKGEAIRHSKAALEAAGIGLPSKTYLIQTRSEEAEATPDRATAEAQRPEAEEPSEVVVAADAQELERLIAAERRETGADDLLSHDAREE